MFKLFILLLVTNILCEDVPIPSVLWHGMGDSCCFPSMMGFKRKLENARPGIYVKSLRIGSNIVEDTINGFLMHPDEQVKLACSQIQSDVSLKKGYNAIGFSQGSQFLRAVAQRCPQPPMLNLITLGGQHQGVYGIPNCNPSSNAFCDNIRTTVSQIAYQSSIQASITQATFWHDPLDHDAYLEGNTFIKDINNEENINADYVFNLQNLQNFVMIKFNNDNMVFPRESQWFGFYKPDSKNITQDLQDSAAYANLGLNKMDEEGRLHFLDTPGNHLQFDWNWFLENVVNVFL